MSVTAPTPKVPADWGVVKTSEVCEVQNGYAFKSALFNKKSEGLPLIRIRDVHSGRSDTFYSGPFDQKYVVSDGDLLIGMDGEFRVRKWRSDKGLLNQRVCRLIPYGEPMIADFLYYSIGRPLKQIEDFTPFTTVKHISAGQIRAIELPLPPLPEQKKIAHILSTVQRAIETQERIIQTTTELKKTLMQKLFTEGLRGEPQKQTEIGPIPESWEIVDIGSLGKCVTGSTPKTSVPSFYDPPSEDFIAPADLGARRYVYDSEKKISPEGMATIRPIPKNAVMCVCIGSSIGKVGMSYREESATNQQINSIICHEGRDPEFVYFLLSYRSEYWKSFATFGPVPILSKGRFSTIVVPIPSALEDQKAIAKPLIALEAKIEAAEKKVVVLQDLFRTLLHELMTAKTRVGHIDKVSQ